MEWARMANIPASKNNGMVARVVSGRRGGPGRGQGRKPVKAGEETVTVSLRMTEAQREQDADIFADYPKYTPGQIGWGTLLQIVEWQNRNGIGDVSADTVRAYRDEGYGAAQAGVMLGLLDYGRATGCEDY